MKRLERAAWIAVLCCLPLAACSSNGGAEDAGTDAADGNGADEGPISCETINDCPSHHLCMNGICVEGTLCTTDEECPAGDECNVIKEVCVPENPCESDDDCGGDTPYCMAGAGRCVACLEDDHCSGTPSTPYCSSQGECVACTGDAHCPDGQVCNQDNICEEEAPECTTDADCTEPSRRHCDPQTHKCYACVTNDHCTGGAVCEPTTHRCVACYEDIHCVNPDPRCDKTTFTCVECLEDTDCPGGQHCNQSSHSCTDLICTSDADCANEPGTPFCDTTTGDCVECMAHDDCGAYQWCRDHACQTGCATDQECVEKVGQDYHCDTDSGDCFYAQCLEDAECSDTPETPHCKTAASPADPPQYTCVECTEDAHCDEFFWCGPEASPYFECRPMPCYMYDNPDEVCHEIDTCYYCDFGDGQCKPAWDCPVGDECCQGYTCNSYAHCERNLDCETDLDCPVDSTCNQTTKQCEYVSCCDPECGPGEFCNADCECESGCHEQGEPCDPMSQNCCEGLTCSLFWPFCAPV